MLLDLAGRERFLERSAQFRALLGQEDLEQLIYSRTLEALGYSRNREPFLELADRLPWSVVREVGGATPPGERVLVLLGLLLESAGLQAPPLRLGGPKPQAPSRTPMDPSAWHMAGVRPRNQPHRRMVGAAVLLARYVDAGFYVALLPLMKSGDAGRLRRALTATDIGPARVLDIVVNVVLPLFHARAAAAADEAIAGSCLRLYQGLPRLEENELSREMATLLWLSERRIALNAQRQQGLIHLYRHLLQQGASGRIGEERSGYQGTMQVMPAGRVLSTSVTLMV